MNFRCLQILVKHFSKTFYFSQCLRSEIKIFKTKGFHPAKVETRGSFAEEAEEPELILMELDENDDVIQVDLSEFEAVKSDDNFNRYVLPVHIEKLSFNFYSLVSG